MSIGVHSWSHKCEVNMVTECYGFGKPSMQERDLVGTVARVSASIQMVSVAQCQSYYIIVSGCVDGWL